MEGDAPKSAGTADGREQRRHPRFALTAPLPLSIPGQEASMASLINISWSGAAFVADQLLGEPGDRLVVETWDLIESQRITLPCHVRWAVAEKDPLPNRELRWLHGAIFAEIDALARRLVENLIHDAARNRPAG
ncbi:MAG: PilZ domain-containing protein [Gemmatimonadales bacterium]